MAWTARYLHSTLALPILLPLLITITTGFAYRFARNTLDYPKPSVHWLLSLHTGSIAGLAALYPLIVAALLLALAVTGAQLSSLAVMARRLAAGRWDVWTGVVGWPAVWSWRLVHRGVTAVVMAPLMLTAVTGAVWTVQQYWLGYGRKESGWLMSLHQGGFIGSTVGYTGVVFVLTLVALGTGITLLPGVGGNRARGANPGMAVRNPALAATNK